MPRILRWQSWEQKAHENREEFLDAAIMKWYMQERSNGVNVRRTEILAAAEKLAAHLSIGDFKGIEEWLWRFRNRHGLLNKVLHGEAGW